MVYAILTFLLMPTGWFSSDLGGRPSGINVRLLQSHMDQGSSTMNILLQGFSGNPLNLSGQISILSVFKFPIVSFSLFAFGFFFIIIQKSLILKI